MQDEQEREVALEAMKEVIRRRMETPLDEWIEMDGDDDVFARARARLARNTGVSDGSSE